jgi:hypothetical protein
LKKKTNQENDKNITIKKIKTINKLKKHMWKWSTIIFKSQVMRKNSSAWDL